MFKLRGAKTGLAIACAGIVTPLQVADRSARYLRKRQARRGQGCRHSAHRPTSNREGGGAGMSSERNSTAIGFLTVVRHEPHGLFGGYLLLNRNGRPLEFHCTAPVKPNRAQEILYGATLESYLYGEAIGATLTAKSSSPIDFLCVDVRAALAVRDFIEAPVALVAAETEPVGENLPLFRVDGPHDQGLQRFSLGRYASAVSRRHAADEALLVERSRHLADHFDLAEPFARIRGAIDEARRGAKA
jgi:hypothetical protein